MEESGNPQENILEAVEKEAQWALCLLGEEGKAGREGEEGKAGREGEEGGESMYTLNDATLDYPLSKCKCKFKKCTTAHPSLPSCPSSTV